MKHVLKLRQTMGFLRSAEGRRTLTTMAIAVGSSLIMTLAA
jgi:hypothetical protein